MVGVVCSPECLLITAASPARYTGSCRQPQRQKENFCNVSFPKIPLVSSKETLSWIRLCSKHSCVKGYFTSQRFQRNDANWRDSFFINCSCPGSCRSFGIFFFNYVVGKTMLFPLPGPVSSFGKHSRWMTATAQVKGFVFTSQYLKNVLTRIGLGLMRPLVCPPPTVCFPPLDGRYPHHGCKGLRSCWAL